MLWLFQPINDDALLSYPLQYNGMLRSFSLAPFPLLLAVVVGRFHLQMRKTRPHRSMRRLLLFWSRLAVKTSQLQLGRLHSDFIKGQPAQSTNQAAWRKEKAQRRTRKAENKAGSILHLGPTLRGELENMHVGN